MDAPPPRERQTKARAIDCEGVIVNTQTKEVRRFAMTSGGKPIIVGRGSESTVVIKSDYVSKEHFMLHWTTDGWEIEDPGSLRGTRVNGEVLKPGRRAPLFMHDTVAFDVFDLRFEQLSSR